MAWHTSMKVIHYSLRPYFTSEPTMHSRLRKVRSMRRLRRRLGLRRFVRNERGVQLAELAIVLPVFFILFGATAEFGRFFYEYTTLAKAARIGSRYLVTAKVNSIEMDKAKNLVVYGNTTGTGTPVIDGLSTSHVIITPRDAAGAETAGVPHTVTVQIIGFKHQSLMNLGGLIKSSTFSLNVDVKPSVTMRYLLSTPLV